MKELLSKIDNIDDIKKLNVEQLDQLSGEIRNLIINTISKTGGHLASNLGVVELTLALHKTFDSPKDKIIWDVGHQAYVHKIITGRKEQFSTIRQYGGLSGFPKKKESEHDVFETGHSSTSISAGIGFAVARDVLGNDNEVVTVIGDGAMTAGMAFEALNHAGDIGTKIIVILNDNKMSIARNVGGLSSYLDRIRTTSTYSRMKEDVETLLNSIPAIGKKMYKTAERAKDSLKYFLVPGVLFEELGFKYLGPVNGHSINEMIKAFKRAKKVDGPVIVHTVTKKGKGYKPSEDKPGKYHSAPKFDIQTGKPLNQLNKKKYSKVFGEKLVKLAEKNNDIVAITAAMPSGTGLNTFKKKYPKRFFDVGIAEQHGVTLAAGIASQGLKPFYAVYSTFLQRGYDQIIHDVCLQNLPVVFGIDRAGLVGNDGETHHGVFDFSYLSHMPNITIMAPKDEYELEKMMELALKCKTPVAIRYPRGYCSQICNEDNFNEISIGKPEVLKKGKNIAIIAIGKMVENALKVYKSLKEVDVDITIVNGRFIKPINEEIINNIAKEHKVIITMEDNVKSGGFGSVINNILINNNYGTDVVNIGLPDEFVEHGNVDILFKKYKMDKDSIIELIRNKYINN